MSDNPSIWSDSELEAIELCLSNDRFERYIAAASGKPEGLELYAWNTALSAAFYGPLQCLEVTLRNAVHASLSPHHGERWFSMNSLLKQDELRMSQKAIEMIERQGKDATPGRVIAELSFGFWVGLFANAYDSTIWRQSLHQVFTPRPKDRQELHNDLDRLRTLRNRIAHHEPIFQRKLVDDYRRIERILKALSPEVHSWMSHHSRAMDVLGDGHRSIDRF